MRNDIPIIPNHLNENGTCFAGRRKVAFTLAEVLITLGIIGVVAAMTLPALVASYNKIVIKNQFKKTYSTLSNAINDVIFDMGGQVACGYEGDDTTEFSTQECPIFWDAVFKKMNVVKVCNGNALSDGCLPNTYADKFSTNSCPGFGTAAINNDNSVYILNDGTMIMPYSKNKGALLYMDVNGPFKNPNVVAKDIYTLKLFKQDYGGSYKYGFATDLETEQSGYLVACVTVENRKDVYFTDLGKILE